MYIYKNYKKKKNGTTVSSLVTWNARRPAVPVCLPPRLGEINTPLHWEEWDHSLRLHPDLRFRAYVVNGIRYSFRVGFGRPSQCRKAACNMASARSKPEVFREYLATECSNGRAFKPGTLSSGSHELVWCDPQGADQKVAINCGYVLTGGLQYQ